MLGRFIYGTIGDIFILEAQRLLTHLYTPLNSLKCNKSEYYRHLSSEYI